MRELTLGSQEALVPDLKMVLQCKHDGFYNASTTDLERSVSLCHE